MLLTNYIKFAYRNLIRHKLFSLINIMGLAIGLAAVMLITLYVRYENNYDSFWKNADNIYRMHTIYNQPGIERLEYATVTPLAKTVFEQDFQQVEHTSRYFSQGVTTSFGNKHIQNTIKLADPALTSIFDFKVLSGSLDNVLNEPSNLIINQTTATKIFGDVAPLGKIVTIKYSHFTRDYTVAAVIEDLPVNSMIDAEIIVPYLIEDWEDSVYLSPRWVAWGGPLFFTLKQNANIESINSALPAFVERHFDAFKNIEGFKTSDIINLKTLNISDIHLKSTASAGEKQLANQKNLTILTIVSFMILFIAATNYMNLSTARASKRAKEVSLRKTVGATRKNLIHQFLGESVILSLIAMVIAIFFTEVTIPFINNWLGTEIILKLNSFETVLILFVSILVGFLGGIYPAFILSEFRPADILKSNQSNENRASLRLRNFLVVLQFSISIILFISTAVVYQQINFAMTSDPGFEKENLLVISNFGQTEVNEKSEVLLSELDRIPNVISTTTSNFMPAPETEIVRSMWNERGMTAPQIKINSSRVGFNYFETYKIKTLNGRTYNRNDRTEWPSFKEISEGKPNILPLVVNESALRQFDLGTPEEAIGKFIYQHGGHNDELYYRDFEIVGVIPDVRLENYKTPVRAEIFFLDPSKTDVFSVKFTGDPQELISNIEALWRQELPTITLKYEFATERMLNEYKSEQNQMTMFAAFSGLAIFIACLGLYGLASFTAERRTKEIGIRKVMGASDIQIIKMLLLQFSKPVLIANIIAWPISYFVMNRWLESFVVRIDDMVIIALCLLAGLTALLIAWATVAGNSYAVARRNPIKALRYE
ncbi:ABC transporter permease [Pseudemcibacter aquimaris]|uniref:ABC transporter permease n=1 Tax=Pseudemcibacter aquimaris TaxID=2857064 RepID=UPI0020120206|nr:ABC transporter permease [Pseudemcibacter aquimaris]MCC3859888.1 ABC transporter permease [Pseudemcibacter aquimaris]WDU57220.1 ABC transporter permease [Pseudemcibacter aquimaris]